MILRICRPEKRNALTCDMYQDLSGYFQQFDGDGNLRALVIFGQEDIFTAGNDIMEFINRENSDLLKPVTSFLEWLTAIRKPVLAGVRGAAIGIGTTMLLHCDLVYAGRSSMFQLPFVQLGLVPEAASSLLLPQLVGHRRACDLLFFGEPFNSEVAREAGIVNKIIPDHIVEEQTLAAAHRICEMPARSIRNTKKLLCLPRDEVRARMQEELELFSQGLKSEEAREALNAFVEKRKPDFSGFE